MKKNNKLPTLLGVLILFVGMIAGIYLINSRQVFKLSANIEAVPSNVRFSNISDTSVTVSWTTNTDSNGFVKWGNTQNSLSKVALEEAPEKSVVHSANITNLTTGSDIFFKISSDGTDYDNGGAIWQTKTLNRKINPSDYTLAAGTVLLQDGSSPAKALVYLSINGVVLSGLTSNEGSFIIPVSTFIENVSDTTAIEITINAGPNGTSQSVIYPKMMNSIPTMIVGKTYDFRSLTPSDSNDQPKSSISIPESVEISSRFEVEKVESPTSTNTFTIDSVDDGEIITTTDPDFFGSGPKNTDIEIAVESELQEVALTTDSKGAWNWSPPNNLEPGEHKIILKWRDATGVLRTLTRNFVVAAAEGPAFESTPSATPVVEVSSSPSATPKASKTPTATSQPTPETGSLTPTLGLFIMGIGVLLSSLYIWNKSHVY